MRRTANLWPSLLTVSLVLLFLFVLLGGTDADTYREASQQAAIKEQAQALRFAKAAQAMCGDGAAWELIEANMVQCFQHTGRKTNTANVTQ